jgi:hypothetical protein
MALVLRRHRRYVRVLEFELYSRAVMSGDEVALLLED